ncbi:PLP-dependent aminotransferase family protein [Actinomadura barringtoniae]|uniref:PLP-dependent aminotransferase family protein n=1 Tax=Actinomadura barringtoniae TaxID=1427535 RepID=A0A939P5Z4_9ACTN|nr:PLP-dependent aminotransferase family protein [Actinomadura barringtoniae]
MGATAARGVGSVGGAGTTGATGVTSPGGADAGGAAEAVAGATAASDAAAGGAGIRAAGVAAAAALAADEPGQRGDDLEQWSGAGGAFPAGSLLGDGKVIDLRPGAAWLGELDTAAWRRAWRLAATVTPAARPDPHGLPGLRALLADYARRSRGVACTPERLLVTRGSTNGLDLLASTVLRPGDRVGVEDPGYGKARSVLAARGAELVPCPVDEHGLIVEDLPDDLRLVCTTPSHQYPLGGVLPVPRRQALLAWARRTGALIAEDDYDGEFRYDVAPLPALYGLDPEVVVYLGTTAKILTSDVGVGWLIARPDLVEAIARRRAEFNDRTAVVPQEAIRLLLERGDLARYIRRMRAEYARRRAVVAEALDGLTLLGDTAGLHVVVLLPQDESERVTKEAAQRGVLLDTLERHFMGPPRFAGLVIGYGSAATTRELRAGCTLVRELAAP